ncbi:MAG: hypothetical protein HUJ31_16215 [Pseudomonadales bacterium]|nr:hypothetical protein [Pseudomonadales bacterium]
MIVGFVIFMYVLDESSGAIIVAGQPRDYLLHVPASVDSSIEVPLVISLHGAAMSPATQQWLTRWNEVADRHGFIVAYPSGTGIPKVWSTSPGASMDADVLFIDTLIRRMEEKYRIDPSRIYVNGHSNGGGFAFALSCLLDDRFAAYGIVAGAQTLDWQQCGDAPPRPVLIVHGVDDPIVPQQGGASGDPVSPRQFPDIESWTRQWAARNQCESVPTRTQATEGVTEIRYTGCRNDVILYLLGGYGHGWPGGNQLPAMLVGNNTTRFDATDEMWRFYEKRSIKRQP